MPDNVIERISVSRMEEYSGLLGCIIKNKQTNDNNKKLRLFPGKMFLKHKLSAAGLQPLKWWKARKYMEYRGKITVQEISIELLSAGQEQISYS